MANYIPQVLDIMDAPMSYDSIKVDINLFHNLSCQAVKKKCDSDVIIQNC